MGGGLHVRGALPWTRGELPPDQAPCSLPAQWPQTPSWRLAVRTDIAWPPSTGTARCLTPRNPRNAGTCTNTTVLAESCSLSRTQGRKGHVSQDSWQSPVCRPVSTRAAGGMADGSCLLPLGSQVPIRDWAHPSWAALRCPGHLSPSRPAEQGDPGLPLSLEPLGAVAKSGSS